MAGRSLNDLVSGVLAAAVEDDAAPQRALRVAGPAAGTAGARPRNAVIQRQHGSGRAAGEALAAERDAR